VGVMLSDMQLFAICNVGGFFVFLLVIAFHFVTAFGVKSKKGIAKKTPKKQLKGRKA